MERRASGEKVTFIELPDSADQHRQQLIQNAPIKSDTFSVLNLDVVWTSDFAANKWILPLPTDAVPTDKMIPATVYAATYCWLRPNSAVWVRRSPVWRTTPPGVTL